MNFQPHASFTPGHILSSFYFKIMRTNPRLSSWVSTWETIHEWDNQHAQIYFWRNGKTQAIVRRP